MSTLDFLCSGVEAFASHDADLVYWKNALLLKEPSRDKVADVVDRVQVFTLSEKDRSAHAQAWIDERDICVLLTALSLSVCLLPSVWIICRVACLCLGAFHAYRAHQAQQQLEKWSVDPKTWLKEEREKALKEGFFYALEHHSKGSYEMATSKGVLHPFEVEQLWRSSFVLWKQKHLAFHSAPTLLEQGQWVDEFWTDNPLSKEAFEYAFPAGNNEFMPLVEKYETLLNQIATIRDPLLKKRSAFVAEADKTISETLRGIPPVFTTIVSDGRGVYYSRLVPNPVYQNTKSRLYDWKKKELEKLDEERFSALAPYFVQTIEILKIS